MGTLLLALLLQTRDEIGQAVQKGLEVIKNETGELATWTLVYADVPQNPGLPAPGSTTSAALQAMIFEELHRRLHLQRIAQCVQQLIDTQCRDGLWDVGHDVDPIQIPVPPKPRGVEFGEKPKPAVKWRHKLVQRGEGGGEKGDLEHTRWALWGLRAGERAGLMPPAEVVEKAAAAVRKGGGDAADVVSCLCICDDLMGKDWKRNPDVLKAVERLAAEKRTEPKALYGLKRAMFDFDSETLGGVEWYPRDVKILLAAQKPDGSWGSLEETCYATLTLHRPRLMLHR